MLTCQIEQTNLFNPTNLDSYMLMQPHQARAMEPAEHDLHLMHLVRCSRKLVHRVGLAAVEQPAACAPHIATAGVLLLRYEFPE
jgi:hypothetical protein